MGTIWSTEKNQKLNKFNKMKQLSKTVNNNFNSTFLSFNTSKNTTNTTNAKKKSVLNTLIMNGDNSIIKKNSSSRNRNISKNLPWAVATWHLFHIIPAKISNENFIKHKEQIIKFIVTCCNKLPCPYCKSHAQNYLSYHNINLVRTNKELEIFLYHFHNKAHRIEKNILWEDCMPKYKTMNILSVLNTFEKHFFKSFVGGRYFSDWIRNGFKDEYNIFKSLLIKIIV